MAFDIDAAAAGPPGQLGVLPRRDRHASLAVELLELLEHDGAGGHVDTESQGLGREDCLHELLLEELLHDLLERREHSGVVGGDTALQAVQPLVVAENCQVFVEDGAAAFLDNVRDLVALELRGESHAGPKHLLDRLVAADPTEDEEDGRQQVAFAEHLHDAGPIHLEIVGTTSAGVPSADILHLA